jgi:hypothetical protein
MTRDDIIKILEWHPSHVEHGEAGLLVRIERVVAQAEAQEREACANEADYWIGFDKTASQACAEIATAIRARSQQ